MMRIAMVGRMKLMMTSVVNAAMVAFMRGSSKNVVTVAHGYRCRYSFLLMMTMTMVVGGQRLLMAMIVSFVARAETVMTLFLSLRGRSENRRYVHFVHFWFYRNGKGLLLKLIGIRVLRITFYS